MLPEAFDSYAAAYDAHFTNSLIGKAQRSRVFQFIAPILTNCQTVLEVNCGTGEDAITFAEKGKTVLATDISSQMIAVASAKKKLHNLQFKICNATEIDALEGTYDLVFSNFGGLNCLNAEELSLFSSAAAKKLKPHGFLIVVLMSNNCFWEKLYFLLKNKPFRRKLKSGAETTIEQAHFTTFYYSDNELKSTFKPDFYCIQQKPIGLFIPPSYMENKMRKRPRLLKLLIKLEKAFANFSFQANSADHILMVLQKKNE